MTVSVAYTVADLLPHLTEWDNLAANAVEPNVFYESWLYLPALKSFGGEEGSSPLTVLIWQAGRLIGLVPLIRNSRYRSIPCTNLRSWEYLHCYLGTPLVRKGFEPQFFEEFFGWLDHSDDKAALLEFRTQNCDGLFAKELSKWCKAHRRSCELTSSYSRALLETGLDPETYLKTTISGKRRKEFKRKSNRLAEQGTVTTAVHIDPAQAETLTSTFLKLERSGWKGRAGALDLSENSREFFISVVNAGLRRSQLNILTLELDGRSIAMQVNLFSGNGSFSFKIAYDEKFSFFSPGVLIELKNLESVLNNKNIAWMDSCAAPNHPMINGIWRARRSIGNFLVARKGIVAGLAVQVIGGAHKVLGIYRGRGSYEVTQS